MKVSEKVYDRYLSTYVIGISTDKQYETVEMIVESDSELSKYNDFKIQCKKD